MAGETAPPGQAVSFDEERCRDFLVHELGIEIARFYRYSEGIDEVRRRVRKRFGDDNYVHVMRLFQELLGSDDNAAGLGDDGDLWRSWRHEYKLHKDALESPGAPRAQAAAASSTALSETPTKCNPVVLPEPVDVTIEQTLQSGVEQQKNRHVGVQVKAAPNQEPEGDDSTAKPARDAKGRPKRGSSLKLSGIFRKDKEHGAGSPNKKQIVKSSSERALLGMDGISDDRDSCEVFSDIDSEFAFEITRRPVVEKRRSALSLDGADDDDDADEEDYWNDDYDSSLAEDITQILSPLEQFARSALQQHGRISDPFADQSAHSGHSGHSGHSVRSGNRVLLEGIDIIPGARFGRGSGCSTPSSCYDSPQRSPVPRTPSRQSPSHESPSHGNPACGTATPRTPRTPVQGTSAHESPAHDTRSFTSVTTAITATTERDSSLRYLDYLSEEISLDEPSTPNKVPRSPMKQMIGENGWLLRTKSTAENTKSDAEAAKSDTEMTMRSSSFKDVKGMMKRKAHDLSERLSSQFAAGTASKNAPEPLRVRISVHGLLQARIYAEMELMVCATANQYLTEQNSEGRISQESCTRVMDLWKSQGRPDVEEFRLDQASQRKLIIMNLKTVRFYGADHDFPETANFMLKNWKALIVDMSARHFYNPDHVMRHHFAHASKVLDLLGARIMTVLAFHDIQRVALQEMGVQFAEHGPENNVWQPHGPGLRHDDWFLNPIKVSRSNTRGSRPGAAHRRWQPIHGTAQAFGPSSRASGRAEQASHETARASGSTSRPTSQAIQFAPETPQASGSTSRAARQSIQFSPDAAQPPRLRSYGARQSTRTSREGTQAARLAMPAPRLATTQPRSNSVAMRSSVPTHVLSARALEKMPARSPTRANTMGALERQPTEVAQPGPRAHRKVASNPGRQQPEMVQTGPPLFNAAEIRYPNERIFPPPETGEYLRPRVYIDPERANRRYHGE